MNRTDLIKKGRANEIKYFSEKIDLLTVKSPSFTSSQLHELLGWKQGKVAAFLREYDGILFDKKGKTRGCTYSLKEDVNWTSKEIDSYASKGLAKHGELVGKPYPKSLEEAQKTRIVELEQENASLRSKNKQLVKQIKEQEKRFVIKLAEAILNLVNK